VNLLQDLRYGARQLRTNPGFTAVAVLSLALGIGANSAIFQLIDAVRLRALPVHDPQSLAYLDFAPKSNRSGWFSTRSARFTYTMWEQLHKSAEPFSDLIAWSTDRFNLSPGGEARWAESMYVSGNFFRVLGVQPILGRTFSAEDDQADCGAPGAVISSGFWEREFGGDPGALGRTLTLDGRRFPVIGVTSPSFFGVEVGRRFDVAVPLCADMQKRRDLKDAWWLSAIGRLKPGWTVERADAYIKTVSPSFMEATMSPKYRPEMAQRFLKNKLAVTPGAAGVSGLRRQFGDPLWLLLAATGLVLLIACANVANLLLARASVRERELAIRQAIGASRGRLITQLLSESLLLAFLGTVLGVAFARILSQSLVAFLSTERNPVFVGLGVDLRMIGFTAGVATLCCLIFGLLPAIRATRAAPVTAMRAAGRGLSSGRERFALRRFLVTAQVALSLVLLVGALLFAGSLRKLLAVDAGFQADGLVAVSTDLRVGHYSEERLKAVSRELEERIQKASGVTSAGQVLLIPISGGGWDENVLSDKPDAKPKDCFFNVVGPGYLRTMGITLLAGRDLDDRDRGGAPKVAVVNEEFAKQVFGGGNPVGRVFRVQGSAGEPDRPYQVVGLIRNAKYYELREDPLPTAYWPAGQAEKSSDGPNFMARINGPARPALDSIKSAIAAVNPGAVIEFRPMSAQLKDSLALDRLMAALAVAFGVLAGVLAAIGLYGVIAYMVARRRNEIGVRIALGAGRGTVIGLVMREAAVLLVAGIVVGTGLSLWATRAARTLLFGLKPNDPATFVGAIALLALVALVASYAPALRAARVEPMQALRED
jgi:putative ABC transport system permease protein